MRINKKLSACISGMAAGAVNGIFGAGGGMILVPLLTKFNTVPEDSVFPSSVSIIFPICAVSLLFHASASGLPVEQAWPYLIGGTVGGFLAGKIGGKIPSLCLHRILGVLILWGGVRYLC